MRAAVSLSCIASSLAVASASSLLSTKRDVSPDMTCGNTGAGTAGYTCPDSLCCSQYGYCGSGSDYCDAGCQSAFGTCNTGTVISPDMTCGNTGAGTMGYTCPDNLCCSQHGYCGSSTDYCATGCQANFGTCSEGSGDDDGNGDGDGESGDGRCGAAFNNQSCSATECCSAEGYCGTTTDHCKAPDCQFQFGPACDANKVPSGANTTTLTRSKVGDILYGGAGVYDCVTDGVVALTYDDGPSIYTSHLLDLLTQYDAKATFFITGVNNGKGEIDDTSLEWPSVIQRMHNDGHQIASHTWSHADLSAITSAQRKDEMVKNEMALRNILGFIPTYMRPPYSSCTAESGCQNDLADLGYHVTYFDLDTQDYLHTTPDLIQTSKDIFDAFFVDMSPTDGDALAIAHDIHEQTVYNLTEYMLQGLQTRGFKAVTVGECLGDPVDNWYRQRKNILSIVASSRSSRSSSQATFSTTTTTLHIIARSSPGASSGVPSSSPSPSSSTNPASTPNPGTSDLNGLVGFLDTSQTP